jgi:hypothetical protein
VKQIHNIRKKAKICAIVWTIIYILLFPILIFMAMASLLVFDKPGLSLLKGLSIVFIYSLLPLSIPVSIDLMWSSYAGEEYQKTLIFWAVPWLAIIAIVAIDFFINWWL